MRQPKLDFGFNGKWTRTQGVELVELPNIPRPELKGKSVTIPGRDGDLWMPENAYGMISFDLKCRTKKDAILTDISSWLTGFGDLILPNFPDFHYRARLVEDFPYVPFLPRSGLYNFTVKCQCQPFRYRIIAEEINLTAAADILNPGTWRSLPIITVYGKGDGILSVGMQRVTLWGMSDYVTLDSETEEAFKGGESYNASMEGGFPALPTGKMRISWSGGISRVAITPRWRWL